MWCVSSLIDSEVRNEAWSDLNFLKFPKAPIVAQHVINFREYYLYPRRMYIMLFFGCGIIYKYQLSLSDLMCHLRPVFSY